MAIIHVSKDTFASEVLNSAEPVLVDFFATWCMPCKMMGRVLEQLTQEDPSMKIVKIDIDENPELAAQYHVMSIPTFMTFKDGKAVAIEVGGQRPEKLKQMMGR